MDQVPLLTPIGAAVEAQQHRQHGGVGQIAAVVGIEGAVGQIKP
jgi:hypothetical protein